VGIHLKFKNILSKGELIENNESDISDIITSLREQQKWLHEVRIDDIIEYFDEVSKFWKEEKTLKEKFNHSLEHITKFISKENLVKELSVSLRGNYKVLDSFNSINGELSRKYHAQPRGLTVHWIAGNVTILGIFSIVQALITKNVCLVKVPHEYEVLRDIIYSIKHINTDKIKGIEILKCLSLVYVEKTDLENQQIISLAADARIAWGGQEAVESILSLKKKFFTEDIIFGPKYSYVIIDAKSLKEHNKRLAQKLALDVSVFDQYACNSPHTVLLENIENNEEDIKKFVKTLGDAMGIVNRLMIPKQEISEKKAMDIISLRTEYDFSGDVTCSKNTDWTIIFSKEKGLAEPCFSRVIFVRPFETIEDIKKIHNRKIQSIALEISDQTKKEQIADEITKFGGDRCPHLGMMSLYSSPWDGMFTIDRLVRWIPLDV
jgi:hypothetical protein